MLDSVAQASPSAERDPSIRKVAEAAASSVVTVSLIAPNTYVSSRCLSKMELEKLHKQVRNGSSIRVQKFVRDANLRRPKQKGIAEEDHRTLPSPPYKPPLVPRLEYSISPLQLEPQASIASDVVHLTSKLFFQLHQQMHTVV